MKIEVLDRMTGYLMYFLIIGLFVGELAALLAIAHLDAVHECQASTCTIERLHTAK